MSHRCLQHLETSSLLGSWQSASMSSSPTDSILPRPFLLCRLPPSEEPEADS